MLSPLARRHLERCHLQLPRPQTSHRCPRPFLSQAGLHLFTLSQVSQRDAEEAVERAISAGYRHIDSAYMYQNEEAVGRALQKKMADGTVTRDDIFCTTKVLRGRPPVPARPKLVGCQTSSQGAGGGPAGRKSDFPCLNPATCVTLDLHPPTLCASMSQAMK